MSPLMSALKPKKIIFPNIDPTKMVYNLYTKQYITKTKRNTNRLVRNQPIIQYYSQLDSDSSWIGDNMSIPPEHNHNRFWM